MDPIFRVWRPTVCNKSYLYEKFIQSSSDNNQFAQLPVFLSVYNFKQGKKFRLRKGSYVLTCRWQCLSRQNCC